ncbi:hypothetical protein ACOSQ3_018834 [Xanthoceras sorbifolium]
MFQGVRGQRRRIKKCKQTLKDAKVKKKNKNKEDHEIRMEVNLIRIGEEEEEVEGLGSRKKLHILGSIDKLASNINPEVSMSAGKSLHQQHITDVLFKERIHSVQRYVARWVYEAGIPFNANQNNSFIAMVESIGQFGLGFKQPTRY